MTNNERFNAMINSCENPREALRAAAPIIRSTRSSSSYPQEGDNVAALTARLNACKHRRKIFNALVAIANSKDHPAPSLCSRPAQAEYIRKIMVCADAYYEIQIEKEESAC